MKDYQNDFSIYCDTIIQQKKIDIEQFQSTESRNAQFRDRMNSIETELQKKFEEMINQYIDESKGNIDEIGLRIIKRDKIQLFKDKEREKNFDL